MYLVENHILSLFVKQVSIKQKHKTIVNYTIILDIQNPELKLKVTASLHPQTPSVDKAVSRFKQLTDKQRTDLSVQSRTVQNRVNALREKWDKLNDLLSQRKTKLEEAIQSQQVSD